METIAKAAIRYRGIVYSLPTPARHHHVIMHIVKDHHIRTRISCQDDGFVTSSGRFVNREEAYKIAIAAGQFNRRGKCTLKELFSEDVW